MVVGIDVLTVAVGVFMRADALRVVQGLVRIFGTYSYLVIVPNNYVEKAQLCWVCAGM